MTTSMSIVANIDQGNSLLCPVFPKSLILQGEFGDDVFNYIQIEVKGCDLGEELCESEERLFK